MMTKPKYQIGDRATIEGLSVEIVKVNRNLSLGTTYFVQFVDQPHLKTIVREDEIDSQITTDD
ncbi:MAG: hypothetical protein AAF652_13605 [Cyanobacteria bacterium P01_C01_bin.72]